jgi:hypothetical protein
VGQNNRQRRAAKQRRRVRERRDHGYERMPTNGETAQPNAGADEFATAGAEVLLHRIVTARVHGRDDPIAVQRFEHCAEQRQQHALDAKFATVVEHLFDGGWTPADLFEALRRKGPGPALPHLLDVASAATAAHPAALVHPRWLAQLDQLGARRVPGAGWPTASDWSNREYIAWPAAAGQLINVLAIACSLPVVEHVLPRPGKASPTDPAAEGIDEKVLRRVRGLLAKAESTEHEEEADALTAKAQELMTRHSIERALADTRQPTRSTPAVRRLWLDNPYLAAKSLLVTAVADANHCRSVLSESWGFATIIGHDADLDVVELLTTSLLVQATRAMTLAGSHSTRAGTSRTRSFRQSFLVAFASRIGERLRQSAGTTEAAADASHEGTLLPVLAARIRAVDDRLDEMFPQLRRRDVSVSNYAGWGAGRAAADLAQFDIRDAVTGR